MLQACPTTYRFWNGRIVAIRPSLLLDLREGFSDPFLNGDVGRHLFVDDPVDGGAGDAMSLRDLAEALPTPPISEDGSAVEIKRPAPDPDLEAEYGRISEQVRQTKGSTLQVAQKHFNAPVDTVEGTVKSVHGLAVELNEYPGRTFHFSSVGGSMADLTRSRPAPPTRLLMQLSAVHAHEPSPNFEAASTPLSINTLLA